MALDFPLGSDLTRAVENFEVVGGVDYLPMKAVPTEITDWQQGEFLLWDGAALVDVDATTPKRNSYAVWTPTEQYDAQASKMLDVLLGGPYEAQTVHHDGAIANGDLLVALLVGGVGVLKASTGAAQDAFAVGVALNDPSGAPGNRLHYICF